MDRHFRPAMHAPVRLFVGREAVFEQLHDPFARALGNRACLHPVERAGGAGADGLDNALHDLVPPFEQGDMDHMLHGTGNEKSVAPKGPKSR